MNILVIGGGGREHAIIKQLRKSPKCDKIWALPGNGGIASDAECAPIAATDLDGVCEFAAAHPVDFAVVAPDDPLALGLVDRLHALGIPCFGPCAAAARIEASKSFAKDLMRKYDIPTAEYALFSDYEQAAAYVEEKGAPIVVKADGLALGKGVTVAQTVGEAKNALKRAMPTVEIRPTEFVRKTFSGDVAVIVTSVAKASGSWHVAGVFNLGKRKRKVTLDLNRDLGLPEKDHTAFEFWSRSFAEVKKGRLTVELPAGGCAAFRLTPVEKAPFVAGSTRHLLQGAVELTKWGYDPEKELLSGTAELVAGDETELWFRAPEGFRFAPQKGLTIAGQTAKLTLKPLRSGPCRWKVACGKA